MRGYGVEGIGDVVKGFEVYLGDVKKVVKEVLDEAVEEIRDDLEFHAPLDMDSDDLMNLQDGIYTRTGKDGFPEIYFDEEVVERALYVNYGTVHQEAQNFVEKVINSHLDRIEAELSRRLGG